MDDTVKICRKAGQLSPAMIRARRIPRKPGDDTVAILAAGAGHSKPEPSPEQRLIDALDLLKRAVELHRDSEVARE